MALLLKPLICVLMLVSVHVLQFTKLPSPKSDASESSSGTLQALLVAQTEDTVPAETETPFDGAAIRGD